MPMRRDSKLSPSGACFAALLSLCCAIFCYALEVAAAPGKTEGSLKAAAILPISSVTLSVKADPYEPDGVTVTDCSGSYACVMPEGNYAVTAHLNGYTCSPAYREVTVPGAPPANFELTEASSAGDGVTTCWAVLVGIADYAGTANDLDYCDDDARGFADALAAGGNWQDTHIELLVDRQATAANIWAALQRMATNADGDDLCVFFFSGHGTTGTDVAPMDEGGGYDEYLCETDMADNIRDDQLGEWIATLPTEKVMCVLCACYSGGFIKGVPSVKGLGRGDPPGTPRNGFAHDLRRAMVVKAAMQPQDLDDNGYGVVITAADEDESCAESADLRHDVLCYYLLEGMAGPADANANDWLTAEEIYGYAAPKATTYNPGQHAQLYDADTTSAFPCLYLGPAGPALSWLGAGGYRSDGVDPDRADDNDWYTFKVGYTGPTPSYVRLHLLRYGVEVVGSPYTMNAGMGNPSTGQTFWFKRRLCKGTYSYFFTASDGSNVATGAPTQAKIGPVSGNRPPRLAWAGLGEWATDPVDPQGQNLPGTEFTWKIKYIDREGDAPQYVRVHVARRVPHDSGFEDQELADSPFDMTAESTQYMNGAVFAFSRQLHAESRYVCWFSAKEAAPAGFSANDAHGVPTWWRRNMVWVFNAPPVLKWVSGANFGGDDPPDGLHPNTGKGGDTFTFKVQYRDQEGTQPTYVRLHLLRWNGLLGGEAAYKEIGASPFEMTTEATDFESADYSVQVQINDAGRYRYHFSASDSDKDAIGEPSWHRMLGPIVNSSQAATAQVVSMSCWPTAAGAQATFTLSDEARVTAELLNIAGRPVKLLVADRLMPAGTNTLIWDGRNAAGVRVPSGLYLMRVSAADDSGSEAQALGTMRIVR